MKLNLGSGLNNVEGYVNVDKFDTGKPDMLLDLEKTPWPFEDSSVDEVKMNHSLEHMGNDPDVFLAIMKELYRILRHKGRVVIDVPHPRHDSFINDPTHVRIITPELLSLFSRRWCLEWQAGGFSNTPLALYIGVNFEIVETSIMLEQKYVDMFQSGEITEAEVLEMGRTQNNIMREYHIEIEALKDEA